MKRNKTGVRAFFFSFFLSLALLGGVGAGLLAVAGETGLPKEVPSASYVYTPTEEDALTVLLMGTEKDTLPPERYTLLRFLPAEGQLYLVPLPPELEATVNITTGTLPALYDYGGVGAVKKGVENAFFVRVDRFVKYNDEELSSFVDRLGGITCEVEETVEFERNGKTVRLTRGIQQLDGETLLAYRDSPLFAKLSEDERIKKRSELLKAGFEQKCTASSEGKLEEWFSALTNTMQTDLSRYDFTVRKEALSVFLSLEREKTTLFFPEGSYREEWDGEKFTPSPATKEQLQRWFEPID